MSAIASGKDWKPSEDTGKQILRLVRFRPRRTASDKELIKLVRERLESVSPTAGTFAKGEYIQQLSNFDDKEIAWSTAQYVFTIGLAVLGIVVTVTAALGSSEGPWKTTAIIAGALVAAVTALNQTWNPSAAATSFKTGYADLRAEGWNYLNWLGPYKTLRPKAPSESAPAPQPDPKSQEAYDLFAENVQAITKRATSIAQKEQPSTST